MGELLWQRDIPAPAGNVTRSFGVTDPDPSIRVFTMFDKETISWSGFSIDDGSLLWTTESENPWNFYSGAGGALMTSTCGYGKLYSTGYSGIVYCYDLTDGTLLWEYVAEAGFATPYGNYPLGIAAVADGKLYLTTNEHSSGAPYWKGAKMRCIDTETGDEIWTLESHGTSSYGSTGYAVADGYLVYLNLYDMQVYCIGKGTSKTTVEAPLTAVTRGSSVMIRGSVTDQSAGTKQNDLASRFPNGVPAVSDESMGVWMEYLYMQKLMPQEVTGVTVHLTSIDPNGNFQDIGYATTDISGSFGISWVPPVPGDYFVMAEFEGSASYGSSYATTYFTVDEAPAPSATIEPEQPAAHTQQTPTEPEPTAPEPTQTTEASGISTEVAIIAVVAVACVIGVVAFWALRKRK
jgi:outer membrane protein assembly factor BamB